MIGSVTKNNIFNQTVKCDYESMGIMDEWPGKSHLLTERTKLLQLSLPNVM